MSYIHVYLMPNHNHTKTFHSFIHSFKPFL